MALIGISIAGANLLVPHEYISEYLFTLKEEIPLSQTYDEVKHMFEDDYDRANPATKDEVLEEIEENELRKRKLNLINQF